MTTLAAVSSLGVSPTRPTSPRLNDVPSVTRLRTVEPAFTRPRVTRTRNAASAAFAGALTLAIGV